MLTNGSILFANVCHSLRETCWSWWCVFTSGFSVLQVQGPCPFRIEVTNSFMQPQPPTEPVGREAVVVPNPRKTAKYCPPDPSCGLFGPMTYDAGGRTNTGKQRAPINTTPTLAVSSGVEVVFPRGSHFLPTRVRFRSISYIRTNVGIFSFVPPPVCGLVAEHQEQLKILEVFRRCVGFPP